MAISWDVVKEIVKTNLKRNFAKPRLKDLRQIAIDEISIGAGHRYLTIVLDLASGAVVHVGRGKGGDALTDFWKRLRSSGAKIEAVGMDMSPAFIQAVMTNLPQAKIIFDRFHVMKLLNDKLSDLRRAMYRDIKDNLGREVLKGSRWLLLKRPENLDPKHNEKERLEEALRLNAPLATAYYLKEELYEFWEQEDYYEAETFLLQWIESAEATKIRQLVDIRPNASHASFRPPELLRLPHLQRPAGRHQQQNQNHETPSLRIPRSRVLPTQNLRPPQV